MRLYGTVNAEESTATNTVTYILRKVIWIELFFFTVLTLAVQQICLVSVFRVFGCICRHNNQLLTTSQLNVAGTRLLRKPTWCIIFCKPVSKLLLVLCCECCFLINLLILKV